MSRTLAKLAKTVVMIPGLLQRSRPGLVVLLYHRVGVGRRNIDLTTDAFRSQLAYLSEHATVVSLTEGLAAAADPNLSGDLVALTFDDGTEDFHGHVLPLLVEFDMAATLYVATGPVEEGLPFPTWSREATDIPALTWSQVREAIATGLVKVGSHTHTHADLDRADPSQIEEELRRSKGLIEERLAAPCADFAYPHAVSSPRAEDHVRRWYETAAVGGWRKNHAGAVDPYRISRVPVTRLDGDRFFRAKARGEMAAESILYRMGGTRRA